jgi:anti-sigma28 factor (negative regulator of flagellin synthesis)
MTIDPVDECMAKMEMPEEGFIELSATERAYEKVISDMLNKHKIEQTKENIHLGIMLSKIFEVEFGLQIFEWDDKDIELEEEELKKIDQLSALLSATIELASNVMNSANNNDESDAISKMLFNLQIAEDKIEQLRK